MKEYTRKDADKLLLQYVNKEITEQEIRNNIEKVNTALKKYNEDDKKRNKFNYIFTLTYGLTETADKSMCMFEVMHLARVFSMLVIHSRFTGLTSEQIKNNLDYLRRYIVEAVHVKSKDLENSKYVSDKEVEFLKSFNVDPLTLKHTLTQAEIDAKVTSEDSPYFNKPVTSIDDVFKFR